MKVDSYTHVSDRKFRPIESLMEEMKTACVDHAVLIQPLGDLDNNYLRSVLEKFPERFTAVGLIETNALNAAAQLRKLIQGDGFAGIRATSAILSANDLLLTLEETNGVLLLHLPDGVGVYQEQIASIAERFANLRIHIPHLGWPIQDEMLTPLWYDGIDVLSAFPNITIGISAVYHFSATPFPHQDTWKYIELIIRKVGAERCLFGSDFPLLLETESYSDYFSLLDQGNFEITSQMRNEIMGMAAIRFWSICL